MSDNVLLFPMDFASVIHDRAVSQRGNKQVWLCQFHEDHTLPGNCYGYSDGRFHCFACSRSGSLIDLYVYYKLGRCADPGQKLVERFQVNGQWHKRLLVDEQLYDAYREAFSDTALTSSIGGESFIKRTRPLDQQEGRFLTAVADVFRRSLTTDLPALAYLDSRGVGTSLDIIGVARSRQMRQILDIARQFGDEELAFRCGLTSTKEKYRDKMHFLLKDSIVVFQKDKHGRAVYYQARTLRTDRNTRYYCPHNIEKQPLYCGDPKAPLVGVEGFFKAAWALQHGWRVWTPLGIASSDMPTNQLRVLHGELFVGDRGGPGIENIRTLKERTYESGIDTRFKLPPSPHAQLDDWARAIGYKKAADYLQIAREY